MATERPGAHRKTISAGKNYDTRGFVADMHRLGVTTRVGQHSAHSFGSAINGRTMRHAGYAKSINARRGIEKVIGCITQWGGLR